jgi:hypothetical protein
VVYGLLRPVHVTETPAVGTPFTVTVPDMRHGSAVSDNAGKIEMLNMIAMAINTFMDILVDLFIIDIHSP